MNELEPIDPDLLGLLEAEREIDPLAEPVRSRVFTRLAGVLPPLGPSGGGGGGGSGSASPSGAGPGAAAGVTAKVGATVTGKVLASAALIALGAVGGAAVHAAVSANRAEPVVLAPPPRIVISIPAPAPAAESTAVGSAAGAGESPAATTAAPTAPSERGPVETQLKAERLLLAAARTALGRGDTDSALAAVQRHAHEYPRGQLTEEREVLRVQILKTSGNDAAARERAAAFKRAFPKSLMQDAVDQAAKSGPSR